MRALAAMVFNPPVFSHWSAGVLHGLPLLGRRQLARVHVTVTGDAHRGRIGVAAHLAPLSRDVVQIGTIQATSTARTVVDIALGAPFREGIAAADGALHAGLQREVLVEAVERAADRRGAGRARRVVAFARAEAESAAESQSRVTMLQLGVVSPELQFEVFDRLGLAGRLDFWFPRLRVGGEVDGEKKYLDPALARRGAGRAVVEEKWREDRVRSEIQRLARWGWREAGDPALLGPILARAGVLPERVRPTFEDYCVAATLTRA